MEKKSTWRGVEYFQCSWTDGLVNSRETRRCLFTSRTGVCFGIGVISACFHDCGSRASEKEQLRMSVTTGAKISAFSFNNQAGILSGPGALVGLRDASFR